MRIEQITFTRFIAAIAIVFFHFGKPLNIFAEQHIHKLLVNANIGVSYFFILSGFVMIIAYGRKSSVHPASYIQNRFARIYPVYLLAILLSLFYKKILVPEDYTVAGIILNFFAMQSWVPSHALSINFPGWSLSVELLFYTVFPFVFNYFYRKHTLKQLAVPIIIVWILSQWFFLSHLNKGFHFFAHEKSNENFLFYFPLLHLNQFLIGNLAGLLFVKYGTGKQRNYDGLILLLTGCFLLSILFKPQFLNYHNGLLAIVFIPIILLMALNTGLITKIFNHKFLVYLGEISYGIYILQVPVYMSIKYLLNTAGITGDLVTFVIGITGLLFVSALSYEFIETPLREKIKKNKFNFFTKTQ